MTRKALAEHSLDHLHEKTGRVFHLLALKLNYFELFDFAFLVSELRVSGANLQNCRRFFLDVSQNPFSTFYLEDP